MSLHRYNLQSYAMNVRDAAMIERPEELDLNAPYQRGSVWTDEQRVNLIRSLMEGIPVGIVYRNFRGWDQPYFVVDGKQRIETIRAFYNDELRVPANWFEGSHLSEDAIERNLPMVSYVDLSATGKRHVNSWSLSVYETRLHGEAQEKVLFDRINFGGTPHEQPRQVVDAQTGKLKAL